MTQHLIISPHLDDAWFCLGGSINEWRKAGETVTVIDVFSIQIWTIDEDLSLEQATRLRKQEEKANARRDGVRLKFLDLREAHLRGYESIFRSEIDWRIDRSTLASIVASLQGSHLVSVASRVYFPLGVGGHVDHLLVREVFTRLAPLIHEAAIGFYEDLPYASCEDLPMGFISQHQLTPKLQAIDLTHKLTAVCTYTSQIDEETIAGIKSHAMALGNGRQPYERVWMLQRRTRDPYQIKVL